MKTINKILLKGRFLFIVILTVNCLHAGNNKKIEFNKYEKRVNKILWNLTNQLIENDRKIAKKETKLTEKIIERAENPEKDVTLKKEIKKIKAEIKKCKRIKTAENKAVITKDITKYKEILEEKPDCLYAHIIIADAYLEMNEFDKSKKILISVLPKLKSSSYGKTLIFRDMCYLHLGRVFKEQNKYVEARKVYEKAHRDFSEVLKKNPTQAKLKKRVTRYKELIIQQDKNIKEVEADKEEIENIDWSLALFESYKKADKGDYPGAISKIEKFKEFSHDYPVYYYLGEIYRKWDKISKSIKMYKKQISINPNHIDSYYELVEYYYKLGKYDKVRKIGHKAKKIKSKDKIDRTWKESIKKYLDKIEKNKGKD